MALISNFAIGLDLDLARPTVGLRRWDLSGGTLWAEGWFSNRVGRIRFLQKTPTKVISVKSGETELSFGVFHFLIALMRGELRAWKEEFLGPSAEVAETRADGPES